MSGVLSGRLVGVVLAVGLAASACGDSVDVGLASAEALVAIVPASTTTTTTTTTTITVSPSSTTSTTTTTTVPVDPHETFVANIVPTVAVLNTFDEPDGERVSFEYAITNPTYFGNPLALMVIDETDDGRWLKVQIPVRPNGTEAWIRSGDAEITSHRFHAEVVLSDRSVTVWNGDEVVVQTGAVVGAQRSPTPVGQFFVNDLVQKWDGSAYGPYILSLSAFSEALESFGGGVPVIAIHGTNNPGLIGGAHSNGCIRIPNEAITVLAETVPMGTPVDIIA